MRTVTTLQYKKFPKPVRLMIGNTHNIIVNAWDAVESMVVWPDTGGRLYRIALQQCRDALDGISSPSRAHRSFTAAAREAGILV